jgi:hypothetical protein
VSPAAAPSLDDGASSTHSSRSSPPPRWPCLSHGCTHGCDPQPPIPALRTQGSHGHGANGGSRKVTSACWRGGAAIVANERIVYATSAPTRTSTHRAQQRRTTKDPLRDSQPPTRSSSQPQLTASKHTETDTVWQMSKGSDSGDPCVTGRRSIARLLGDAGPRDPSVPRVISSEQRMRGTRLHALCGHCGVFQL